MTQAINMTVKIEDIIRPEGPVYMWYILRTFGRIEGAKRNLIAEATNGFPAMEEVYKGGLELARTIVERHTEKRWQIGPFAE